MKTWIKELKDQGAWENRERGDWMEWLLDMRGWPEAVWAVYVKRRANYNYSTRAKEVT